MNDNLDDWLNSLGIDNSPVDNTTPADTAISLPQPEQTVIMPEGPRISNEEFNNILSEYGFQQEPSHGIEEAEEVEEDTTEDTPMRIVSIEDWDNNPQLAAAVQEAREQIENHEQVPYNGFVGDMLDAMATAVRANMTEVESSSSEETSANDAAAPLIPPNSPSLLINDAVSRFSGTEWFNEIQKTRVIVAGCGGIGSNLAFQIARMNPATLFLYDDDVVEQANMSGQLFSSSDVGKAKVDAVSDMIKEYTITRNIFAIRDKFTDNSEAGDIMLCGFDSMKARDTFFKSWCTHILEKPVEERRKCVFIDGRLSIDTLQVFCITGDNAWAIKEYRDKYLFSDNDADETVCSMKQTTYLACMIGSLMTNLFTNWVANTLNPVIPYDLPFFTEYDAQNMIFKTVG